MPDLKPQLSSGIPVRLPIQLVLELKECAAKQQRTPVAGNSIPAT